MLASDVHRAAADQCALMRAQHQRELCHIHVNLILQASTLPKMSVNVCFDKPASMLIVLGEQEACNDL
jgi:hypothetical protein